MSSSSPSHSSRMKAPPGPEMEANDRIKAINGIASEFSVNADSKASHYVRSGKEMLRCASNYEEDGNPEHAYILYMRFLTMFLDKLRHHPGFKELPPADKKQMNSTCNAVLPKAETLRKSLITKYQDEHAEYLKHVEMAVRKAQEQKALSDKKKADEERHKARLADVLSSANKSVGNKISSGGNGTKSQDDAEWQKQFPWNDLDNKPEPLASAPPPESLGNVSYSNILQDGGSSSSTSQPGFDRNTKPNRFLSPMSSGLRQVVIPDDLISLFLRHADKNTRSNVETCGFLTGKIMGGRLVVTDLIIPKQEGGPDSCTTRGEEEYFQIQDKLDLITLGWIHTHPTQTAFLSSVDMHSQYMYQQMMPEAIAIVCAPSKGEIGTFTLNPIEGMDVIGNCRESGFHTHPFSTIPLFIDATHCLYDKSRNVKVHDIR